jgi:acylphosphatase
MPGSDPEDEVVGAMFERGYRIVGRVQGVGFRWWARGVAVELGITGIVRNDPDGSVTVIARGGRASLDLFEGRLKEGPLFSRVDRIENVPFAPIEGSSDFTIEH